MVARLITSTHLTFQPSSLFPSNSFYWVSERAVKGVGGFFDELINFHKKIFIVLQWFLQGLHFFYSSQYISILPTFFLLLHLTLISLLDRKVKGKRQEKKFISKAKKKLGESVETSCKKKLWIVRYLQVVAYTLYFVSMLYGIFSFR